MAVTGSTTEAAAKVIAAKTVTTTITGPRANALVESPELPRTRTIARTAMALRNIDDLFEMLPASL
jgi:hypothetical protein